MAEISGETSRPCQPGFQKYAAHEGRFFSISSLAAGRIEGEQHEDTAWLSKPALKCLAFQ
jgi:hypothetical protein